MMKRDKLFLPSIFTVILALIFCFMSFSFAMEPKPGDVINSENIDQYQEYFPFFMQRYIKDGWGFEKPVVVKVKYPEPLPFTQGFIEASKKNIKSTKLNEDGLIEGFDGLGVPFLELKEPDIAIKIMWNQYYKEVPDDWLFPKPYLSINKRKGGTVAISESTYEQIKYFGRLYTAPTPELKNPNNLLYANKGNSNTPPFKDMAILTWRYKDPLKYDDMWAYVPSLRRSIRLVSSERANPINGSPYTWDDIFGFDGKIPFFTFKLIGEQTVLNLANQKLSRDRIDLKNYPFHPVIHQDEEYEPVPCYVIEIRSKESRYPSARKVIWVSKDNFWVRYSEIYDKSNDFWKGYYNSFRKRMMKTGDKKEELYPMIAGNCVTDFKTLYYSSVLTGEEMIMNGGISPRLFQPGSLGIF